MSAQDNPTLITAMRDACGLMGCDWPHCAPHNPVCLGRVEGGRAAWNLRASPPPAPRSGMTDAEREGLLLVLDWRPYRGPYLSRVEAADNLVAAIRKEAGL